MYLITLQNKYTKLNPKIKPIHNYNTSSFFTENQIINFIVPCSNCSFTNVVVNRICYESKIAINRLVPNYRAKKSPHSH